MNSIIIGQNDSGKGKMNHIKKIITQLQNEGKTVVILDPKNQYKKAGAITIHLDKLSPLKSPLGLNDMKVLNAGYEKKSNLLYKKAEQLLSSYHHTYDQYRDRPFDTIKYEMNKMRLMEETVERLNLSDHLTEKAWGERFSDEIPLRCMENHVPMEKVIDVIKSHQIIRLTKQKNIQASHLRALIFFLLYRLSLEKNEEIYVVADEMPSLLNKGNTKLFLETIDQDKVKFVVSFNKTSDIPVEFIPITNKYFIHKIQDKQELKKLETMGFFIEEDMKRIFKGEFDYIEIEKGKVI